MRRIILSLALILTSILGFSQFGDYKIVSACKSVHNLDSAKFHYVIHKKGTELLLILRQVDIDNYNELYFVPLSTLVEKDKTLNDLPEIPEGKYAYWNEKQKTWIIKKGGLKEVE